MEESEAFRRRLIQQERKRQRIPREGAVNWEDTHMVSVIDAPHIAKTEASAKDVFHDGKGSPLALTDNQLDTIMKHAMPLHPRLRRAFIEHVAVALRGQEIGDGSLHRACVMVWRQMFDPPDLSGGHVSKWSR
jgi:hypothetical protein